MPTSRYYTIKPRVTKYTGISFRSKLEAVWAVFFESIPCQWEYELQGYQIRDCQSGKVVNYRPDFFLTDMNMFVEVKPTELNSEELEKAVLLVQATGKPLLLCIGSPVLKPIPLLIPDQERVVQAGCIFTDKGIKRIPSVHHPVGLHTKHTAAIFKARGKRF